MYAEVTIPTKWHAADRLLPSTLLSSSKTTELPAVASRRLSQIQENRGR